ncbi:hypothetical protein EZ449_01310 [Pedobacter frigidisoli]|uniref:Uncharacterized protein n=1 Tax=Pedobacter frigidisoli TaxID=2530455 RepID=A0A4R0P6X8_9SPHI|nr:hypothetical protein [Pedobacter frigidisoli]TCD12710.1 hypothetical protein EZ449_01310 [Pedobacter frigidisoli]
MNFIISYLNQQLEPNIMALAYINLSSKQYFNFMCITDFERRIFHDTYKEFQRKSKIYSLGQSLHTFSQMCLANEKANSLHQKLHYSVMSTIEALENKMPLLSDMNGNSVLFDWAELHIYASDLMNKAGHVVSINYTSPKLVLHEIVGDLLILSYDVRGNFNETFMVKMTDDLVVNYDKVQEREASIC